MNEHVRAITWHCLLFMRQKYFWDSVQYLQQLLTHTSHYFLTTPSNAVYSLTTAEGPNLEGKTKYR
jgi:hypothetical protein